mmetsp:Transcript_22590/g.35339  ORF Transcript_22590/g.35339 Transcript_22590/m.35339 type:complete len:262 (+) Transcript_22590:253-1038(+)
MEEAGDDLWDSTYNFRSTSGLGGNLDPSFMALMDLQESLRIRRHDNPRAETDDAESYPAPLHVDILQTDVLGSLNKMGGGSDSQALKGLPKDLDLQDRRGGRIGMSDNSVMREQIDQSTQETLVKYQEMVKLSRQLAAEDVRRYSISESVSLEMKLRANQNGRPPFDLESSSAAPVQFAGPAPTQEKASRPPVVESTWEEYLSPGNHTRENHLDQRSHDRGGKMLPTPPKELPAEGDPNAEQKGMFEWNYEPIREGRVFVF